MKTRFESKYIPEPNSGCWLWEGCVNGNGYSAFGAMGKSKLAHRVAYELYVGPIPEGLCVLHRCDVPACVNPAHLWLGTNADNVADRCAKGRSGAAYGNKSGARLHPESRRGDKNGRAKLTTEQVLEIRAAQGFLQRELAARYGVGQTRISSIRRRFSWAHVA